MSRRAVIRRTKSPRTRARPRATADRYRGQGREPLRQDFMLALNPAMCFTEAHCGGFPGFLARLPAVTVRELRPLIVEALRCQAPKDIDTNKQAPRHRRDERRE